MAGDFPGVSENGKRNRPLKENWFVYLPHTITGNNHQVVVYN